VVRPSAWRVAQESAEMDQIWTTESSCTGGHGRATARRARAFSRFRRSAPRV